MKCQTPGSTGEHEAQTISHSVLYRERTFVVHNVPASICPECGDAFLAEETIARLDLLLPRKARAKRDAFVYEL